MINERTRKIADVIMTIVGALSGLTPKERKLVYLDIRTYFDKKFRIKY